MNPTLLPPAMSKIVGQIEFYSFGLATSLGERKVSLPLALLPYELDMKNKRLEENSCGAST